MILPNVYGIKPYAPIPSAAENKSIRIAEIPLFFIFLYTIEIEMSNKNITKALTSKATVPPKFLYPKTVEENIVNGGMIPKIENALAATDCGVSRVVITSAQALDIEKGTQILP